VHGAVPVRWSSRRLRKPIFRSQSIDPRKVSGVVGYERGVVCQGDSRNERVDVANRLASPSQL
jgi:hypothetical protein